MTDNGHHPHILVVNNSLDILVLKEEIYEEEGYRVSTRLRAETGVPEIVRIKADLLVLDYVSGEEADLLVHIRGDPRTAELPILLCTGARREVEAIQSELSAMGVRVIYKPFDIDHLLSETRKALGVPG